MFSFPEPDWTVTVLFSPFTLCKAFTGSGAVVVGMGVALLCSPSSIRWAEEQLLNWSLPDFS